MKKLINIYIFVFLLFVCGCATNTATISGSKDGQGSGVLSSPQIQTYETTTDINLLSQKVEAALNAQDYEYLKNFLINDDQIRELASEDAESEAEIKFVSMFVTEIRDQIISTISNDNTTAEFLRVIPAEDYNRMIFALDLEEEDDFEFVEFYIQPGASTADDVYTHTVSSTLETAMSSMLPVIVDMINGDEEITNKISTLNNATDCQEVLDIFQQNDERVSAQRKLLLMYAGCAVESEESESVEHARKLINSVSNNDNDMPYIKAAFAAYDNDLAKMNRYYDYASSLIGGDVRIDLLKMYMNLSYGNYELAKQIVGAVIKDYPENVDSYFAAIDFYLQTKEFEKIAPVFKYMNEAFGYDFTANAIADFEGFEEYKNSAAFKVWQNER